VAVLPVGIDLHRFRAIPRAEARARLGLDPDGRYLLFPHDPARPLKRHDRAVEAAGDVPLLTLGNVAPDEVPYWINAANAVLVPSEREAFGLSVIEALACGVPVLGTPVGIHPVALQGVAGAYCAPFERDAWRAALRPHLEAPDPRVDGRRRAALFSADAMAARVVEAWRDLLQDRTSRPSDAL
jgi:glycosyltransferase involved in cell wall biosynthesis